MGKGNLTPVQARILQILKTFGPLTDDELLTRWQLLLTRWQLWTKDHITPSSLRTRRAELRAKGEVRNSSLTRKTKNGRTAIAWEATPSWIQMHVPAGTAERNTNGL
jgi:hypothetical protein